MFILRSTILATAVAAVAGASTAQAATAHLAARPALSFAYVALPDHRFVPVNVVKATDGSLWVDAQARVQCHPSQICTLQKFGHVANGQVTLFDFPLKGGYQSLSAGPGGTAWIVAGTSLYVFNESGALVATYPIPAATFELTVPALGPDGRMWLTDFDGDLFAVTAAGSVTTYACPNFCGGVSPGRDGMLWGTGLGKSYQQFIYSATTSGTVYEYGVGGVVLTGPGQHLEAYVSLFQLDSLDKNLRLHPLANLQSLNLDQSVAFSSSNSELWFVGSRNGEAQAIVGTVSLRGAVKSEPFGSAPCNETYVYFSALTQGSDGAMYGGFGCGDNTGTHAGYLARVAPKL
jgi:hypothetical protein